MRIVKGWVTAAGESAALPGTATLEKMTMPGLPALHTAVKALAHLHQAVLL